MNEKTVGQRILDIRGKDSRKLFADKLGVGTATLQRYENGERLPDIDFFRNLQELSGCSLDYLVNGEESSLSTEENLLLDKFRRTDSKTREKILLLLLDESDENFDKPMIKQKIRTKKIGQVMGDNAQVNTYHNKGYINQGNHQGDVNFGRKG